MERGEGGEGDVEGVTWEFMAKYRSHYEEIESKPHRLHDNCMCVNWLVSQVFCLGLLLIQMPRGYCPWARTECWYIYATHTI